jgi:threonine dehydratase
MKQTIFNILKQAKTIAIIGLSPKEEKASNRVAKYIQTMGYKIIPIYPKENIILNEKVYRDVSDIDEYIDILVVFRKSTYLDELVDVIKEMKNIGFVWTQLEVINDDAFTRLKNIDYLQNKCIMVEHKKISNELFVSKVEDGHNKLQKVCIKTPLSFAPYMSKHMKSNIYFKKENLQITGSFKIRGAFNKISSLRDEDKKKTIICSSAGNHAQGVAFSANYFNMKAIIVMPESTPIVKISGVEEYGGEVLLYGDNYDEAYQEALRISKEKDFPFIHPYLDEDVMVGQGSLAKDILDNLDNIDNIIVPVGGGGLILGIARYVKAINKNIKIIGVVANGANALELSFNKKEIVRKNKVQTIADGIAVKNVDAKILNLVLEYVDEIVSVDDREISSAILHLLEKQRIIAEGAGAASVASLIFGKVKPKNKENTVAIISGGNIDVNLLSSVIERGIIGTYRKMKLSITLIDKAGSLKKLTGLLEKQKANIVQIYYDSSDRELEIGDTNLVVSLETRNIHHQDEIKKELKKEAYIFKQMS